MIKDLSVPLKLDHHGENQGTKPKEKEHSIEENKGRKITNAYCTSVKVVILHVDWLRASFCSSPSLSLSAAPQSSFNIAQLMSGSELKSESCTHFSSGRSSIRGRGLKVKGQVGSRGRLVLSELYLS